MKSRNDLIVIFAGRVTQIGIMFLSLKMLTTLLTPEQVGNYYLILSILAFFNLVLLNPPSMYFSRHLIEWENEFDIKNALIIFLLVCLFVSLLSIPIIVIIYHQLDYSDKFNMLALVLYINCALIISTMHRNMVFGLNTLGKRLLFVKYLLLTLLIGLAFSIILTMYYSYALAWVYGVVLSELIMLFFVYREFTKDNLLSLSNVIDRINKEKINNVLYFIIPIGISTLLMWIQTNTYRFYVDAIFSAEVLGFVSIGIGISSAVIRAVESVITQYMNPIFLHNITNASKYDRANAWNEMARIVVPVYMVSAIFVIIMSKPIVMLIVDATYISAYKYTMVGVGIEFFRVMTNLLNNVSQSEKKTTYLIKPYLFGVTIFIFLIGITDHLSNLTYTLVALLVAQIITFVSMWLNMRKLLDIYIKIDYGNILLIVMPYIFLAFIDDDFSSEYMYMIFIIYGVYTFLIILNMIRTALVVDVK